MFVNSEAGGFDSNVTLKIPIYGQQVSLGFMRLSQLSVELLDSVMDGGHFLHHLDMSRVVTVLNLRPVTSLLQSGLRHLHTMKGFG